MSLRRSSGQALARFHPLVADWFHARFGAPTDVQRDGWDAIAAGRHALLCAPTGSGKTLAAFLAAIDELVRAALDGTLEDRAYVVYVSPLKALSFDIKKNLEEPLAEIRALAESRGIALPPIRLAARTGDTSAKERAEFRKRAPHVWITTPESLYILLGSASGRKSLAGAHTVVVDEIHALADDKRGAHLALSIARLEALVGSPLRRVGLSATVSPIQEIARLLVGPKNVDDDGTPDCVIVDHGRKRPLDLALEISDDELGPIATHEEWARVLDRVAALVQEHRSTLVFVNTRRLVERVSHQLSERLGEEHVAAHHGSLSRATRLKAEERLKNGELRVCVATASLELGIDVGHVDLVCQIGSPRSVAVCLQRVGRSGHAIDRTPKGRIFPLTRDELIECAAILDLARKGELDAVAVPPWPLDILAQQIVASVAIEPWPEDDLFALARSTWSYRDLPRDRFDQVVEMLAKGFATSRGRRAALILRDSVGHIIKGRRAARITALTSGGAIPDNADYDVVLEPDGIRVGRINEDFAIESMAGDVFLLGNASWRIRRVERSTVRVEDARGAAPTIPFWLGEAPARTPELSAAVGNLRAAVEDRLDNGEALAFLVGELRLPEDAAKQIVAYIEEGKRVLGVVPTASRIVAERFFDETGGMQLVIHAPFGGRINRAWGLALRKRFCRSFDFELQASATDDGVNLSLGPQHSFPLEDVFHFLHSRTVREVATQAVLPSPIFTTRWRWSAGRSLALPRFQSGRKVPPALQRMRADDLLAAVFPAQAACQDNAPPGDIELPDHPLVFETMRDCLDEALDVEGLRHVLERMESDGFELVARDTPQPSVFAHQILNAMPYAFLDDAPLEERRARAVSLRRALPEDERDLGRLDPLAIATAGEDAWPLARDADELDDAIATLVLVRDHEIAARFGADAEAWLATLIESGRALRLGGHVVAHEHRGLAEAAIQGDPEAAREVVRARAAACGPFTSAGLAELLALTPAAIEIAACALEAEGVLLRGAFTELAAKEWCERRILARIHRATVRALRREIEPVTTAVFLRFLAEWQRVLPEHRAEGATGLGEVIECLQGYEAAIASWERDILPVRLKDYDPELLDRLCLSGEVVWGRFTKKATAPPPGGRRGPLHRAASISLALRADHAWLVDPAHEDADLGSRALAVATWLRERGASFADDIARGLKLLPAELDDALGELVASGVATSDGIAPLRRLMRTRRDGRKRPSRFLRKSVRPLDGEGRWWRLDRPSESSPESLEARAAQLLRRWGVVLRDVVQREPMAPPWRDLLQVYRRAEAKGEIRGGRFIQGLVGEQFALPEAVDHLRRTRREEGTGELVVISASDPLNFTGSLTPGPRIATHSDTHIILQDGVPIAWADSDGAFHALRDGDDETRLRETLLLHEQRA